MKPEWLVKINVSKFYLYFPKYEFSVLLFLFVHEHQHFSEAALKCDIVGKEDNYKYLVALYTYHFREQFTFSVFFFLQVCFWAIYDKKLKFSFILGYFE